MFIVGMLSWWYGVGWLRRSEMVRERLAATVDYFSIGLLIRTLFSPFRQIGAGKVNGPLAVKWQAFLDRTVSRVIGALVRIAIIFIGCVTIAFYTLIGGLTLILWVFIPFLPLIGFILFVTGWVPFKWN
jgi:hypothetical protein